MLRENNLPGSRGEKLYDIEDLPTFVINLPDREDRLKTARQTLNMLRIKRWTVLKAVKNACGELGCALSHILALQHCMSYKFCLVVEDDVTLSVRHSEIFSVWNRVQLATNDLDWDVVLLSANILRSGSTSHGGLRVVIEAQTTGAYVVRQSYVHVLLENLLEAASFLQNNSCRRGFNPFAIDQNWKKLQTRDSWYVTIPRLLTQSPGFSDIEQRNVSYLPLLIDGYQR